MANETIAMTIKPAIERRLCVPTQNVHVLSASAVRKKSPRTPQRCRPRTKRIRIELLWGALTLRELATRCGLSGPGATERLIPYLWQMERRTGEVVKIPGKPNKYALRSQQTALTSEWKGAISNTRPAASFTKAI